MIFQHLIDDRAQLMTRRRLGRDRPSSTTRMAARGHGLNIRRWSFLQHILPSMLDSRTKRDLQEGCLSIRRPRLWAAAKLFASVPRTIWVLQCINDHHMMWCDVCENEGDYCAGIFSQSKEHVLPEGRHTDRRFSPCRTGRGQTTGSGRQPWSTFCLLFLQEDFRVFLSIADVVHLVSSGDEHVTGTLGGPNHGHALDQQLRSHLRQEGVK